MNSLKNLFAFFCAASIPWLLIQIAQLDPSFRGWAGEIANLQTSPQRGGGNLIAAVGFCVVLICWIFFPAAYRRGFLYYCGTYLAVFWLLLWGAVYLLTL